MNLTISASTVRNAGIVLLLSLLSACASLEGRAREALEQPQLEGTRWGLVVATLDGREVVSINPDSRFVPASNTKLFTTAAAFRYLNGLDRPDVAGGTSLRLEPRGEGEPPDLVLYGGGDGTLSTAPDCIRNCLWHLAEAARAQGLKAVHDVIGDDTLFPDERWGPGWSWNNLETRSGTAISALTVDDNELAITVKPGAQPGQLATTAWADEATTYPLVSEVMTSEGSDSDLRVERRPGSAAVRVYGRIAASSVGRTLRIGVEDPADIAARRLHLYLSNAGIEITGEVRVRHRPGQLADGPSVEGAASAPAAARSREIARLLPAPLGEDLRHINKVSQNLHAELVLRRLGLIDGTGSGAHGLKRVEAMLAEAAVERAAWDLSDGSGMSTYNRLAPRMVTRFLLWTQAQPWGAAFRETLPIGGVDGTLARRFGGTSLEGKIFAKTGSLNAVNALSGFLTTASGRTLVFSAYANDRPSGAETATGAMDAALVAIAEAY